MAMPAGEIVRADACTIFPKTPVHPPQNASIVVPTGMLEPSSATESSTAMLPMISDDPNLQFNGTAKKQKRKGKKDADKLPKEVSVDLTRGLNLLATAWLTLQTFRMQTTQVIDGMTGPPTLHRK